MAVRNVPPTGSYTGTNAQPNRQSRSFAALYEQARQASINDNSIDNDAGSDTNARRDDRRPAAPANNRTPNTTAPVVDAEQNRRYIDDLHERVDTLRGEILVRVIQASGQVKTQDPLKVTSDISRLSTRLDTLRQKLQQEEIRLSGKLVDVEI